MSDFTSVDFIVVTPAGFEPAIFWMRTKYPGPLDDGAVSQESNKNVLAYFYTFRETGQRLPQAIVGRP